ncbi:formamidopyrimidine-DNA glycosylase [Natronospira proteinivora]|uniref:Formamidopyrimidine-DNA glycosylase n=1 Tax=Natronospira proteinivora TaxID=1807133 RepID=A0ABT1GB90_9GAMM|nr:bifunctional DNA-formamidopyrimidine glycosylase/DNA-(apurinic or apyrimidinic site) lyase [Natronospira proteinivora]MCP1728551.1 formamidopyrimidine-DNA glycosylase [Natronospira proteinivora]
MPELPEVETTRRGVAPFLSGRTIETLVVREPRLRWPVDPAWSENLAGRRIQSVDRRAKYLLIDVDGAHLIWHLGMSGSLRVITDGRAPDKHDHIDLVVDTGHCLRFNDPRRFGFLLFTQAPLAKHPRLMGLGPEPLSEAFNGELLYRRSRGRRTSVKGFVMDSATVVGVGNIYASEALFLAGIHPRRPAGRISRARYAALADAIKTTLAAAIEQGGTTLRDFSDSDGRPGYFSQSLSVYDRAATPCPHCASLIRREVIAQRATYFCPRCQR